MTSKASSAPTTEKPAAVTANGAKQPKQETSAPSRTSFLACCESHPSKKNTEKLSPEQPGPPKGPDGRSLMPYFKNKSTWEHFLKDSKKTCQLIVVNFTTTWCAPCIKANMGIDDLRKKYKDVKFANVDIDELLDVTKAFKVKKMPTFVLLKRKECIEEGSKKDSPGNEGSQKGKESGTEGSEKGKESGKESSWKVKKSGKDGSPKGNESGKEGSQKGKESGKDKPKNAEENSNEEEGDKKSEMKNFMVVAKLEGWKNKDLEVEILKHRYFVIDHAMPET